MKDGRKGTGLMVFGFFVGLSIGVTWPLILNMSSKVPGFYVADNYEYLWKMWWFQHALLDLRRSPLMAPHIFYPYGYSLAFGEISPLHTLLGLPLVRLMGEVFAYNAFLLLSFVFGGWGAYLWVTRLTSSRWAGIWAGIAFTLSPYHVVRYGGQIPLASLEGLPLFFWAVEKWLASRRVAHAVLAGLMYLLAGWASLYYAVGLAVVAPLYIVARLFHGANPVTKGLGKGAGAFLSTVLLGMAPLAYPYLQLRRTVHLSMPLEEALFWSASWTDYLVPSGVHFLWGAWVREQLLGLPPIGQSLVWEFVLAVGYLVLLLALYGWRHAPFGGKRAVALMTFWAWTLSLGPRLQVGRTPVWLPAPATWIQAYNSFLLWLGQLSPAHEKADILVEPDGLIVPMPALVLRWGFPLLFQSMRGWNRFAVFVALGMAALSGMGMAAWRRRASRRAVLILFALLLLELWPLRIPLQPVKPRAVDLWLASQPGEFTIMQLPLESALSGPQLLYTRYHGKRIAFAYTTFFSRWYRDQFPELGRCPSSACLRRLREWKVRYVLIERDARGGERLVQQFRQHPAFRWVGQWDDQAVFLLIPTLP